MTTKLKRSKLVYFQHKIYDCMRFVVSKSIKSYTKFTRSHKERVWTDGSFAKRGQN